MEKNLNVAPTEQELFDAGFRRRTHDEDGYNYTYSKDIGDNLNIGIHTDYKTRHANLYFHDGTFLKDVDLTKAAINAEFKHFNQPLPQWEKPKPKVGEVYKSGAFDEEDYNLIIKVYKTGVEYLVLNHAQPAKGGCTYPAFYDDFTKTHDTLDDYYKEKFLKEGVVNMLYEIKEETIETATLGKTIRPQTVIDTIEEMNKKLFKPTTIDPRSQVEQPHEYSYKGLKAEGKIPHDRSGEDHDSIEAFKKLLAICEALNGMFRDEDYDYYCPRILFVNQKYRLEFMVGDYGDESPIYFTSKEAFDAFNSAPENVELFKTFLKIK